MTEAGGASTVPSRALRPRDYAPGRTGAHDLRRALAILIGAGIGCDEAGEPPEADYEARIAELQRKFLEECGRERIQRAVATWFGVE